MPLRFIWGTVNSGKSLQLLARHFTAKNNAHKKVILIKPALDTRTEDVSSRAGFSCTPDLVLKAEDPIPPLPYDIVFVDEAQFLSERQVEELACSGANVMAFGLRTDFHQELFPASKRLLALADHIEYIESLCVCCGALATCNWRTATTPDDSPIQIGYDFAPVCWPCFRTHKKPISCSY